MNASLFMVAVLVCSVSALPLLTNDCGNGISCAPSQTCMSNATGAGILYACSPFLKPSAAWMRAFRVPLPPCAPTTPLV